MFLKVAFFHYFSRIIFLFIFLTLFSCSLIQFVCAACHFCSFVEPLFQRNSTSFFVCVVSFLFSWLHASMSFNKFFYSIKFNFRRVYFFSSFYPIRCSPTVPFSMSELHCYIFCVAPFNNFAV